MGQFNLIDIFAGCGGLSEGFEKKNNFNVLAAVEWEKPQVQNLINRMVTKWNINDAARRVLRFDIQRTKELVSGWNNDPEYGSHEGLDKLLNQKQLDLIIGGPPCQAFSVAGRIRDENGMRNDYRNYLFESYMKIVRRYQPKLFVFENVPGMLSAKPGGTPVTELIKTEIELSGYHIIDDLKTHAQIDLSEYGVPQKRKRVIIIGLRKDLYPNAQEQLKHFYTEHLPKYKESIKTVRNAIENLPKLLPLDEETKINGKRYSHSFSNEVANHIPRFHSRRDIKTFQLLAEDLESGYGKYISSESLKQLYTQITGKTSNIHKYHVLRWDKPSNTIPAHLYKDGLRHIHPDSVQSRTITVREAARLQTFEDDFEFISSAGDNYKMIGNAVPPKFSEKLAEALEILL
ncbi:DNA (cytosine-5-)-methyltransferase [Fictibacillus sp. 5RED26]|uniref:DNA cytosine methyltransferase n=1 Tax=Fictibacillus sp. 5RED26 TaxID=2745876 RepID=UPI0018CD8719|nr:DNA (cytosine-5-)-methyltransferase [Fictibacillus sp. 5RED26]MBH0157304.1 DNA (cytosine-5-)-methyltransferase [Fictibacillus sp. 5RED26]